MCSSTQKRAPLSACYLDHLKNKATTGPELFLKLTDTSFWWQYLPCVSVIYWCVLNHLKSCCNAKISLHWIWPGRLQPAGPSLRLTWPCSRGLQSPGGGWTLAGKQRWLCSYIWLFTWDSSSLYRIVLDGSNHLGISFSPWGPAYRVTGYLSKMTQEQNWKHPDS